jgi:hypothetical protein
MIGNPTTIAGIPLPSDAPLFLAFIAVHLAAGLTAVVAGAIAMLSGKRPGRHPQAGTVYYWALAVVFVTMSALAGFCRLSPRQLVGRRGENFGRPGRAST